MEIHSGHRHITHYGVKVEVIMVHPPWSVVLVVVDDNCVRVDVENVGESFVAPSRHQIHELNRNPGSNEGIELGKDLRKTGGKVLSEFPK